MTELIKVELLMFTIRTVHGGPWGATGGAWARDGQGKREEDVRTGSCCSKLMQSLRSISTAVVPVREAKLTLSWTDSRSLFTPSRKAQTQKSGPSQSAVGLVNPEIHLFTRQIIVIIIIVFILLSLLCLFMTRR